MKIYSDEQRICGELLRRYVRFHENEEMENIRLWGLANWGEVSKMIKEGKIITSMKKENRIIWFTPCKLIIDKVLKPAYQLYLQDKGRHIDSYNNYNHYNHYIYQVIEYEHGKLKELA